MSRNTTQQQEPWSGNQQRDIHTSRELQCEILALPLNSDYALQLRDEVVRLPDHSDAIVEAGHNVQSIGLALKQLQRSLERHNPTAAAQRAVAS
jgi:hypothetical protein